MENEESCYVWIDKYNNTRIDLKLDDFFKLMSGKEISLKVQGSYSGDL